MKCTLCGSVFDAKQAPTSCAHCPLRQGCKLIRCPNCGYETLPEPAWLNQLLNRKEQPHEDQ